MYYDYQRWYDPSVGRFISQDPLPGSLSNPQSQNPYVYVQNAPTTLADPSGLVADLPFHGYCYDYCGAYESGGQGGGIIVLLGGDVSHLRGLSGFLRVGGPGYADPVSLDGNGPARIGSPESGEIPLTTKNIQVSDSRLSDLIGNSREGQFSVEELVQKRGIDPNDIQYQVRFDKDDFGLTQNRIADFRVGSADIWEVKGGYVSGTKMELQARDYAKLMDAGYKVHHFFYTEPSQPFQAFLRARGIDFYIYGA